jgi:hypothetical protein
VASRWAVAAGTITAHNQMPAIRAQALFEDGNGASRAILDVNAGESRLTLYDANGRRRATLVATRRPAPRYTTRTTSPARRSAYADGPSLAPLTPTTRPAGPMVVDGPGLTLSDQAGRPRAQLIRR